MNDAYTIQVEIEVPFQSKTTEKNVFSKILSCDSFWYIPRSSSKINFIVLSWLSSNILVMVIIAISWILWCHLHIEPSPFLSLYHKNFIGMFDRGLLCFFLSKVFLTELRNTNYYYAVKCLKKEGLIRDDDVECTFNERKVLILGTKHPYLCHLFCTFQTEVNGC